MHDERVLARLTGEKPKVDPLVTHKRCSRCKEEKEVADFHYNKRLVDGYSIYCKECKIELNRARKKANKK